MTSVTDEGAVSGLESDLGRIATRTCGWCRCGHPCAECESSLRNLGRDPAPSEIRAQAPLVRDAIWMPWAPLVRAPLVQQRDAI